MEGKQTFQFDRGSIDHPKLGDCYWLPTIIPFNPELHNALELKLSFFGNAATNTTNYVFIDCFDQDMNTIAPIYLLRNVNSMAKVVRIDVERRCLFFAENTNISLYKDALEQGAHFKSLGMRKLF